MKTNFGQSEDFGNLGQEGGSGSELGNENPILNQEGIYDFLGDSEPKRGEKYKKFKFIRNQRYSRRWEKMNLPVFPEKVAISAEMLRVFQEKVDVNRASIKEWQDGLTQMLDFYWLSWEILLRTRTGQVFVALVEATNTGDGFASEKAIFQQVGHGRSIHKLMLQFEEMGVAERRFWHKNKQHWSVSKIGMAWWNQIMGN